MGKSYFFCKKSLLSHAVWQLLTVNNLEINTRQPVKSESLYSFNVLLRTSLELTPKLGCLNSNGSRSIFADFFLEDNDFINCMGNYFYCSFCFYYHHIYFWPHNQCEMAWHIGRSAVNFALFWMCVHCWHSHTVLTQVGKIFLVHSSAFRLCACCCFFLSVQVVRAHT